jgi:glutamate carboxypeptidase
MREVLRFCESQRRWAVDTTRALAALESPTTDKAAVDRCGTEIAGRLATMGGRVQRLSRVEAGDHLLAEFGCGDRQLLLLCHFDTVWGVGQVERMPIVERDGRLYGPGVYDMKGGLVISLLAIRAMTELGLDARRRIVLLCTTDEETGSASSRHAIEDEARRSDAVLVLEPALPGGAVKTSRKGVGVFDLVIDGVPAHAGADPGRGASAITELAWQVLRLQDLQDAARGISVNVGVVSGGTRSNVVAERATAGIDVRVTALGDAHAIEAAIRRTRPHDPRTQITVIGGINRPPMERTPGVAALYGVARSVATDLGFVLGEGGTGGASDGNFTAALGVPTLDGLGAEGDGAHAIDEHVVIDSLPRRAALLAGIIERLGTTELFPGS